MSDTHLCDIRNCLERAHWKVVEELEGDGYRVSGVWVVERPDGSNRFHLDFGGLDDMRTLPMEQSYSCTVREEPSVSCYLARQGRSWPKELGEFEEKLDEWSKK